MKKLTLCGLTVLLACVFCMCSFFTSYARTPRKTVWSGELDTGKGEIKSNLLTSEGKSVEVSMYQTEYSFTINVFGDFTGEGRWAYLAASGEGNADIELGKTEIYVESGMTEEVDLLITPYDGLSGTETVTVTLTCEESVLSGEFTVPLDSEDDLSDTVGSISYCPDWYNKNAPIRLTVGDGPVEIMCNGDVFPEMTIYRINGNETVMYDGGIILANSGEEIEIDMSRTDFSDEYLVISTPDMIYDLRRTELPDPDTNGEAYVVGNEKTTLPIDYEWQGMKPSVSVEQMLTNEKGTVSWKDAVDISVGSTEEGKVSFDAGDSPAGTYRLTMVWSDDGYETYRLETAVYIRYEG